MDTQLELDGAAFRDLVGAALDRLEPFLDGISEAPASWAAVDVPAGGDLPLRGTAVDAVLDDLFARQRAGINTAAPGFMGYIPGGGIPYAAVADLIANIINRYVGISPPAPHLAEVERDVIRWFASMVGYPSDASGTFTSGGSAANLIGIVAAREARFPSSGAAPPTLQHGTMYISDQAHHSVLKAARFAAIAAARIHVIETDASFRMRADALRSAIADDRRHGLEPFLIVASAGTTNTGAVDPLAEIAEIAAAEGLWLHVDAAYGGFFALTERGKSALRGIERADTLVLDPHKTLFLPYGTGALLVREPGRVALAFSAAAEYLPSRADAQVEAADLGFELTRSFRGLRVWLPLRICGAGAFTRLLNEKLDLALLAAREIGTIDGIELIAEPQLSTFVFALSRRAGEPDDAVNARTTALLESINSSRRVLVTGTTVRGRFLIRPSIVSFRTHEAQVHELIELVRTATRNMTV